MSRGMRCHPISSSARLGQLAVLIVAATTALLIASAAAYSCIEGKDNNRALHEPYNPDTFRATTNWRSCWRLYANGVRYLNGSTNDCTDRDHNINDRFPYIGWLTAPDRAFTCCEGPDLCNSNSAASLRPMALPIVLAMLGVAMLSTLL